jgi:hypothetical protein
MRKPGVRLSLRGMLIGMACGAVCGAIYCFALSERPMDETLAAREFRGMTILIAILVAIGGFAGGVLSPSGKAMFAGGIVGAVVVGIFGVVATLHLKGLIYAFIGAPIGAVLVYLYGVGHEVAKTSGKTPSPQGSADVWDSDLDRRVHHRERS